MVDTVDQAVLKPELPAFIELFEVDCTNIPAVNTVYYFTAMVDTQSLVVSNTLTSSDGFEIVSSDGVVISSANSGGKVIFGNQAYNPFPIAITGIEHSSEGAPPRPTIALANINKLFGALSFLYEDLVGCTVTYIRTFETYLNTAGRISAAPLKYTIAKKVSHTSSGIVWELRSPLDKERAFLPARQMLKKDFPGLGVNKSIR